MNFSMIRWVVLGAGALGVTGCATVPRNAGFADVQHVIAQRAGHVVQWRQNSAADEQRDQAVHTLLQKDLTPESAVQIALLNNPELQATYEDLGIAQADLVQAGLLQNPSLSLERRFPGQAAEIDVAQDFLSLLVIPMRKKIARANFQAEKARVAHEVLLLVSEVKSAYYTFQARQQLLDRLKLVVQLNQAAAELAKRQHEAGTLNELGAANQQVTYEQSLADVTRTEAQLVTDRERLNRLMGLGDPQTARKKDVAWTIPHKLPDLPATELSLDGLENKALNQRMDLDARRNQIVSAARSLGITNTFRYIPTITLSGHYEHDIGPEHSIGPAVEFGLPLFDQGQAQVASGRALLMQARRRYEALAIDIQSQVREAHQRLLAQRQLVERYKAMLPQRMRILQLTLEQYNGMLMGPYDLLLAKQNEVQTEQAYIEAWRDYWIERTELERAMGGRVPESSDHEIGPTRTPPPGAIPHPTTAPTTSHEQMPGMNMRGTHTHGMNMPGM
jgi:cobalt-zinc-cadmium efflux system outer membrane protein